MVFIMIINPQQFVKKELNHIMHQKLLSAPPIATFVSGEKKEFPHYLNSNEIAIMVFTHPNRTGSLDGELFH